MIDPLSEIVTLLEPQALLSKFVSGAGPWRIRRTDSKRPFYCVVIEGSCALTVDGGGFIQLQTGDFTLIPEAHEFTVSSLVPPPSDDLESVPVELLHGEFRLGDQSGPTNVRLLVGHCVFGSPDTAVLVSLLPQLIHIRGDKRLKTLVQLINEEYRAQRPGRDLVLARLLEVLLIEALRSTTDTATPSGLLRGLADERLAVAIRKMHENIHRPWTVAQLAKESALSRSAFFERFSRTVGVTPMEYLLAWRMALAKKMLRDKAHGIAEIAERVGYGSASAFSVAFARHVGKPPAKYALGVEH